MRSTRWLLVLAVVGGCGDNQSAPIDARPDMGGIGTKCDDGIDNDGDGLIDYPADPGCAVPNADDETDDCPAGPACPQCANDIDDDGNGSTDYPNDPGCMSASDLTEVTDNPVACGASLMIKNLPANGMDTGTLDATSTSQIATPCNASTNVQAIAYRINLSQPTTIIASTAGSAFDTVLDLRSADCDDPSAELACHDNVSTSVKTSLLQQALPAGNYYLIVSGYDTASTGAYTLKVDRYLGEGVACSMTSQCGPGFVCRPANGNPAMVCAKPQCADNYDDDNDGKNGFPTDPGCANLADNDETDPNPLPACANTIDDDTDGQTDYPADTSCSSAAGTSEACNGEQDPITEITQGTLTGTLVGAHNDHDATCDGSSSGLDLLFTLRVPQLRSLRIDTDTSSFDTVLSLLGATCAEPSIACVDQGGSTTNASLLTRTNVPAGNYVVALDAYSASNTPGPWAMHVSGVIAAGGSCAPVDTLGGAFVCPASNPCMLVGGAMRCVPSACGDGMDNDNDTITDFPMDPGCTSSEDIDESDTCQAGPGPGCPECADGIDNDSDSQIDTMDSACIVPSSPSEGCLSTDGITAITTRTTTGTTVGATNDIAPVCVSGTQTSPDKTYSIEVPRMRTLSIANSNSFDAVVSLYDSSCGGTPRRCSDEPEDLTLDNLAAGTYYYFVDGYGSNTTGTYTLTVTGIIEANASCEGPLADDGAITCPPSFQCKGAPGSRTCQRAKCGDGVDNDNDGVADYPNDPGCASATDDTEEDTCPAGPNCPACGDAVDNDSDGQIDYPNDSTCVSASSTSETCSDSEPVTPLLLPLTPDTTVGATDDLAPTCGSSSNTAGDKLYSMTLPALSSLSIVNTNDFDAAVGLFEASCGPSEYVCQDFETLTLSNVPAGTYYYFVDGYSSAEGAFQIGVSGTIKAGQSCEMPLALSGALTCSSGYVCGGVMGSRTCVPAQCSDGMDNDSDTKTDFPNDPGCSSPSDNDETDTCPGAGCPVCADGMDNDSDTLVDYPMDPQCASAGASSESCRSSEGIPELTMPTTTGTTAGQINDSAPTCGSTTNTAGDMTYTLQLPELTNLSIVNTNDFDAVVVLDRGSCSSTPVQCRDTPEDIVVTNQPAGTYFYTVDGYSSATGPYTLTISGTIANGGSCEVPLAQSGAFKCGAGYACNGTVGSRTCQLAQCNDGVDNDTDGVMDYPAEPGCDSANDNDETDPTTPAVCSNGMDDDMDGQMDYPADTGCLAASYPTEQDFCTPDTNRPVRLITTTPVTGTTTGATNDFASQSCQSSASSEDVAWGLDLPVPVTTLRLDLTGSAFDTVMSLRDATCATELECNDDGSGTRSLINRSNVPAGAYSVIIDGYSGADGNYTLAVKGTVAAGTSCTSPLFGTGVLACPTGTTCTGTPATCQ